MGSEYAIAPDRVRGTGCSRWRREEGTWWRLVENRRDLYCPTAAPEAHPLRKSGSPVDTSEQLRPHCLRTSHQAMLPSPLMRTYDTNSTKLSLLEVNFQFT